MAHYFSFWGYCIGYLLFMGIVCNTFYPQMPKREKNRMNIKKQEYIGQCLEVMANEIPCQTLDSLKMVASSILNPAIDTVALHDTMYVLQTVLQTRYRFESAKQDMMLLNEVFREKL